MGLYYLQSRYYDASIGRFINADSEEVITVTPTALTDKNLYSYCDNNPITRADDDGEFWITVGIMAVGGLIGAGVSAVASAVTQYRMAGSINWKSVAVSAAGGFVSGAIAASPLGAVGGSGANQNMVLTNVIKTSGKVVERMSSRACTEFATKQIFSTVKWRNNILSYNAWGGSIRFSLGIGISNGIIQTWDKIKRSVP